MSRRESEIFNFNPAADIVAGASFSKDLEEGKYRHYIPFTWIEITNNSGFAVRLLLDGKKAFTCYGRQVKSFTGRPFSSFTVVNIDSAETIAEEDIEVLIQKEGETEIGGGF